MGGRGVKFLALIGLSCFVSGCIMPGESDFTSSKSGSSVGGSGSVSALSVIPSGTHVSISPSLAQSVFIGDSVSFAITPSSGFILSQSVGGTCPSGHWIGLVYVTGLVRSNCTVSFSASPEPSPSPSVSMSPIPGGAEMVSVGGTGNCIVSGEGGNVWCWGYNQTAVNGSALGVNTDYYFQTVPAEVVGSGDSGFLSSITSVSAGGSYCALTSGGNVYCWGPNGSGQLGNYTATNNQNSPVQVLAVGGSGFLSGISQVSVGGSFSCALSSTGHVYCWGDNTYGQLGYGASGGSVTIPVEVSGVGGSGFLSNISQITAGGMHACALSLSGNVYCWGSNGNGQIGNNSTTQANSPVEVVSVFGTGNLDSISQISAGYEMTCSLSSSENVYCWGANSVDGVFGNEFASASAQTIPIEIMGVNGSGSLSDVIQISAGYGGACALTSAKNVYCWGDPQITNAQSAYPAEILGVGGTGDLTDIIYVSFSSSDTVVCVQSLSGSVYCWGDASLGNLGNNTSWSGPGAPGDTLGVSSSSVPVEVWGL